jgi:predicted DNA-binding transcriptional regulator AlpA
MTWFRSGIQHEDVQMSLESEPSRPQQATRPRPHKHRKPAKKTRKQAPHAYIRKAAELKAAGIPSARLLDKPEVMAITGVSFPTIWTWMRDGKFPRSRIVGGKSMWLSTEIEAWIAALPVRRLKGDEPLEMA